MDRAIVMKFAVSAALLGAVTVGCKPSAKPATLSSLAPRADGQAAKLADRASAALARKDASGAVKPAEDAVALAPREAAYRILLGRAYIAAGRFRSAEAVLADALALRPGDGQAELSLALTRIALGKWDAARDLLASARGKVGESDRGLALTLAGDKAGGLEVMQAAARAAGADAKARQNLALGYALSGRWAESASVAAQDLPPEMVRARMTEWARMTQPRDAWDQVAALLHVTPVEDAGMPVALALAPADPAVPAVAAPEAAVADAAAPDAPPSDASAAVAAAAAAIMSSPRDSAAELAVMASPVTPPPAADRSVAAAAPVPADAPAKTPMMVAVVATTPPPLIAAPTTPARLLLARAAPRPAMRRLSGRYVVQLGAFSSPAKVQGAWRTAAWRTGGFAGLTPSVATFGAVQRLSVAGFDTRGAALSLCRQIRAARGECFVRESAGDVLAQWARPGIRLASR